MIQRPVILSINNHLPSFGQGCKLAPNATVVGQVSMGALCTIWFNAVVRGDVHSIIMGDEVNVQDGAVLHCTYQKAALTIGNRVSIAHNAIVHGCTIEDEVLIGMGAIVMDHALVQSRVIVAAGAVVSQNAVLESGWVYAGTPAKKLKPIDETLGEVFQRTAANYIMYSDWYGDQFYTPNS